MPEPLSAIDAHRDPCVWQPGIVAEKDGDGVCIEMASLEHCQRCLSGQGCGAGVFSQLFARQGARFKIRSPQCLEVGDRVRVGVSRSAILKASMALYAWPLALFLGTLLVVSPGWLAAELPAGEWGVLLIALAVSAGGVKALGWLKFQALNPIVLPLSCRRTGPTVDSSEPIN